MLFLTIIWLLKNVIVGVVTFDLFHPEAKTIAQNTLLTVTFNSAHAASWQTRAEYNNPVGISGH